MTGVLPIPTAFVKAQLDTLFEDVRIDAVKIGMLADVEVIKVVAETLKKYQPKFIVLDPVMVAKSGDRLLPEDSVEALKTYLLPLATVLTPNLPEAAALVNQKEITSQEEMLALAKDLLELMNENAWLLLKAGHLSGSDVPDLLIRGDEALIFNSTRIETKNTHGTGCTLSSALATLLPQCETVAEATRKAKDYITAAIAKSDELQVGHGHGPVHHFEALWDKEG